MRASSIGIRRAIAVAVALTAITLLAGTGPPAEPIAVIAQASDDEEEVPERRRGVVPPEEESEPTEAREEKPLPVQGASRRPDPFDASDERRGSASAPHPSPESAIVCLAGCGGAQGAVVYQRK